MIKTQLLNIAIISLASLSAFAQEPNEKWLQDYASIKKYMAEAYANLEWARSRIDLVELNARTTEALKKADSDAVSRKIIGQFLAEFRDGHLKLEEPRTNPSSSSEQRSIPADTEASKACGEMGYRMRTAKFSVPFETVPGFRRMNGPADPFPSGVFTLENGKMVAAINFPIFMPQGYYAVCTKAWEEFRTSLSDACDGQCVDRFNENVEAILTRSLEGQLKQLIAQKPAHFIVDIGGNGGGNDWVKTVARMISPKPLKPVRTGFIRHPHWVPILEGDLGPIKADLARTDITVNQREVLTEAKRRLEQLVKESRSPCDMSFVWTTNEKRKDCTLLNSTPKYSSGLFERVEPDILSGLHSRSILYRESSLDRESIVKTPLMVLVDNRTASAAENLASFMQISRSATVIGEHTFGAGCGYVDGGTKYFLPNSKLRLRMPDCVRFRADGVNEVEGIKPDVAVWEPKSDPATKLAKTIAFLSAIEN